MQQDEKFVVPLLLKVLMVQLQGRWRLKVLPVSTAAAALPPDIWPCNVRWAGSEVCNRTTRMSFAAAGAARVQARRGGTAAAANAALRCAGCETVNQQQNTMEHACTACHLLAAERTALNR